MRVLFVYPNITGHESTHQGLMSISAFLKKHGHITSLIDFTFSESPSLMISKVVKFEPDLIGFTSTSGMFRAAIEFANDLKEKLPVPIIFGGPHATVVPEKVLKEKAVDIVCINEGEEPLQELLTRIKVKEDFINIKNLWVKHNSTIYRNHVRPLLTHLDKLPFPDFKLFDMGRYLQARNGAIDIITGRGCPFQCSYCINYKLQQIQGQRGKHYTRSHSVDYIIRHISTVKQVYPIVNFISFEDDLFTTDKDWLIEFCHTYKSHFPDIHFSCNTRVEFGNDKIFKHLLEAGCVNIHMGIESGDEFIRRKILHRNMSNEKIINAFESAQKVGLNTTSYNILGSPHETIDQIKKTIAINQRVKPDHIGVSIFCPYPGTQLYNLCVKEGLVHPDFEIPSQHRSQVLLKYDTEFKRKIKHYKKLFRYKVYKEYNLKKAIIFLFFDLFYDHFITIRKKMPSNLRKILHKTYFKLIGHS